MSADGEESDLFHTEKTVACNMYLLCVTPAHDNSARPVSYALPTSKTLVKRKFQQSPPSTVTLDRSSCNPYIKDARRTKSSMTAALDRSVSTVQ